MEKQTSIKILALAQFAATAILAALVCCSQAHAAVFFEDKFEEAYLENAGWVFAYGSCSDQDPSPPTPYRVDPCPEIDIATAATINGISTVHDGLKSLKLHYDAAWSDPNPQTHDQAISQHFAAVPEIYTRYWHLFMNWDYRGDAPGTKVTYFKNDAGGSVSAVTGFWWGSRSLGFSVQNLPLQLCPSGNTDITCTYPPNMADGTLVDGTWNCVEEHLKYNTIGQSDGAVEIWVNGVQTLGYYNMTFRASSAETVNWIQIFKQNGNGDRYLDDLAFSTTRIGCGPTSTDTTIPAAPRGLGIR